MTEVSVDLAKFSNLDVVKQALSKNRDEWTYHGIGFLKTYVGNNVRVHLWHPRLITIGMESAVHTHRWDLESAVVLGTIVQEEYVVEPQLGGKWRIWEHGNSQSDKTSIIKGGEFEIKHKTEVKVEAGNKYYFKRDQFHRTVVSDIAATVVHREQPKGYSCALVQEGHTPLRGDQAILEENDKDEIIDEIRTKFSKTYRIE